MISVRELFNRSQLRCTRQRMAVYEALRQCKSHPTADDLYRMAQAQDRGLSRATVYNTLQALCNAGLARQLPTASWGDACCRYDADMSEHLHVRIRDSSEIRDVPSELGSQLLDNLPREVLAQIELEMGLRIDGVNIQLLGRHVD